MCISLVPRPLPSFPSLAVRYCKRQEAGQGPGNEATCVYYVCVVHVCICMCVCGANVYATYSLYFPLCTCYYYSPSHPTHLHTSCSVAVKIMIVTCYQFAYIYIAITVVWQITPHFICDVIFYLILWHTFSVHIVFTTLFEFLICYLFPIRNN